MVLKEVKVKMEMVREYVSNSLAIVANFARIDAAVYQSSEYLICDLFNCWDILNFSLLILLPPSA